MLLMISFILLADAALDALTSAVGTGEAGTSSISMRVVAFAIGEVSASEIATGAGRECVEVGLGIEEARVDGAPAKEAKEGQV